MIVPARSTRELLALSTSSTPSCTSSTHCEVSGLRWGQWRSAPPEGSEDSAWPAGRPGPPWVHPPSPVPACAVIQTVPRANGTAPSHGALRRRALGVVVALRVTVPVLMDRPVPADVVVVRRVAVHAVAAIETKAPGPALVAAARREIRMVRQEAPTASGRIAT